MENGHVFAKGKNIHNYILKYALKYIKKNYDRKINMRLSVR